MGLLDFIHKRSKLVQLELELDLRGDGSLVDSIGDFGLELARESDENLVYSAFSVFEAWLRVWAGAQGPCRDEIGAALQLKDNEQEVRAMLQTFTTRLATVAKNCTLTTVNAIWVRPGLRIEQAFEAEWGGATSELDFSDAAQAASIVNQWVAERTNKMIRNVVDETNILPDMAMILANAIYLKAKWKNPFDESDTMDEVFNTLSGEKIEVPTMSDRAVYQCVATDEIEVLRKPYRGGALELIVVLPGAGRFKEVRRKLSFRAVKRAIAAAKGVDTILSLPKFSIESSPEIDPFLKSRGAIAIYDASKADLSAFSPDALASGKELFVGKTIHRARIDVDEEGTEAAAASVVATLYGAGPKPPPPNEFLADRPFLYFIVETTTNLPIFAGQVVDPR